jgi:putative ABC transport system permease protein
VRRARLALWLRWSWRHLRQRWALLGALALVIALGTGSFAGLGGTSRWRILSNDASFAALAVHDLRAVLPEGTSAAQGELSAALARVGHPEWVEASVERLVARTQVDASIGDRSILVPGTVVGVAVDGDVDTLYISAGRAFTAADVATATDPDADPDAGAPVALLHTEFAEANDLPPSGTVRLAGDRTIAYVGHAVSPDYFMVLGRPGQLTTAADYAVVYLPLAAAQDVVGQTGRVNEIVVRLAGDLAPDMAAAAAAEITAAMQAVGAQVTPKEDDPVYRALYEDATSDQQTWNFFAVLILLGASFATFNLLSRMVDAERREIGIGMAIGVPPTALAARHLLVGIQVALAGAVFGVGIGALIGAGMRGVLQDALPLPIWRTPFPTTRYLQACALGVALPILACAIPVWRAVRVDPVEAIRTGPRRVRHGAGLTRMIRLVHGRGNTLRLMPVRNLLRAVRRTVVTALGIAAAMTAFVAVFGLLDSFYETLDRIDDELGGTAPHRLEISLDQVAAVQSPEVQRILELGAAPGEASGAGTATGSGGGGRVETFLRLPATLIPGGDDQGGGIDVVVAAIDLDGGMWTPGLSRGALPSGPTGVVVTDKAANDLGVGVGDAVTMRHVERGADGSLRLVDTAMTVTGTHPNPLRVLTYLDHSAATLFGLAGAANAVWIDPAAGADVDALERALFSTDGVASVDEVATLGAGLRERVGQFKGIIRVLQAVVLLLALLIAVNSASISHDERAREQATMFAFGVPVRTVLGLNMAESAVTGLLGSAVGIGAGRWALGWIIGRTVESTLPDLGMVVVLSTGTVAATLMFGVGIVAAAPLLTTRRLTRMDVPATLRVLE